MEVLQSKKSIIRSSIRERSRWSAIWLYNLRTKGISGNGKLSELCEYLTGQYSDGWLTMTVGGIPVLAAGDPLSVINNLSTFIFS